MRKKVVRAILIACGIVVTATAAYALLFGFRCVDTQMAELESTKGTFKAAVFEANCHATEPVVTHINLRRSDRDFKRSWINGTVNEGQVLSVLGGGYNLQLKWVDESTLKISCPHCKPERILEKNDRWKNVSIIFE